MKTDTIAAIATSLSESGISIIRISGPEALAVGDRIYRTSGGKRRLLKYPSHSIHYGYIVEDEGISFDNMDIIWKKHVLDEVMVSVMLKPKSYTAEDTVEINCHGGVLITRKILEAVLAAGARLAEPGEFTKRAFLNGRIDLSRAEAVMDVIGSKNEMALSASISQLQGALSDKIRELRGDILYEIAFIESALDDPEHISLEGYPDRLAVKIAKLQEEIGKLVASADNGKLMEDGIRTVIVGKPNAGKSSLLNLLVGEERAIVTDVAGTTRDVLQEFIRLHGIGFQVIDTAGIHSTENVVEKIGVEKARKYAGEADLLLYVADASVPLDENDREILKLAGQKNIVILLNKSDLLCKVEDKDIEAAISDALGKKYKLEPNFEQGLSVFINESGRKIPMIRTSAVDHKGFELFERIVRDMFFDGAIKTNEELVIKNMRHKEALLEAKDSLSMVKSSLEQGMPEDFYSIDLMSAYSFLGKIIGEEVGEDLVNEIFSRFCMGK